MQCDSQGRIVRARSNVIRAKKKRPSGRQESRVGIFGNSVKGAVLAGVRFLGEPPGSLQRASTPSYVWLCVVMFGGCSLSKLLKLFVFDFGGLGDFLVFLFVWLEVASRHE